MFFGIGLISKTLMAETFIEFLATRHIIVCPVTLRRKENTGIWTRILMSFNSFNNSQKDNPCTNRRKTVANLVQELSI